MKLVMFDHEHRGGGFTLVEITVALAISSALAVIIFAGQRHLREQAQFSDSIERIVSTFQYAKNTAFTTANTSPQASPDPDILVMGTVLKLNPCPSTTMELSTLRLTEATGAIDLIDTQSISTTWQTCFDMFGWAQYVAFIRQPETGQIQTYPLANEPQVKSQASYLPVNQPSIPINYRFTANGREGFVVVDSKSNSITRRF